jgi:hypothetical protein
MNEHARISDELSDHVSADEREALDRIARRLESERPVPRAGFRSELHSQLVSAEGSWRPARLRLAVAAYSGSGVLLLGIAAIGLAGAGPLAY